MEKKFFWFVLSAVLFMVAVGLCGCRTQYLPVEKVRTEYRDVDTAAIYSHIREIMEIRNVSDMKSDSLIDSTSETVVLNEHGDTTRHVRTKYVYSSSKRERELENLLKAAEDKISFMRLQLSSIKSDTIPVPYPVEKVLTRWQKVRIGAFWPLVTCIAAIIGWMFLRRKFNFKK